MKMSYMALFAQGRDLLGSALRSVFSASAGFFPQRTVGFVEGFLRFPPCRAGVNRAAPRRAGRRYFVASVRVRYLTASGRERICPPWRS